MRWSKHEETMIINMRGVKTYNEIAEILGRSVSSLNGHVLRMKAKGKLQPLIKQQAWTTKQEAVIIEMYSKHTQAEIAEMLGRDVGSVTGRIIKMRKSGRLTYLKYKKWTKEEESVVIDMYLSNSCSEIAERIGRNYQSTASRIKLMKQEGRL